MENTVRFASAMVFARRFNTSASRVLPLAVSELRASQSSMPCGAASHALVCRKASRLD
ncbi:unannotated protein [freshwater metagenome]|uniref:Unannotated protein n=1 Tax=freshwater metagenome TaxID=449393 RepID=A0A6J7AAA9_9ZZZZ